MTASSSSFALSSHGSDTASLEFSSGVCLDSMGAGVGVGVGVGVECAARFASSAWRRSSDLGSAKESIRPREADGVEAGVNGRLARPFFRFGVFIVRLCLENNRGHAIVVRYSGETSL